MTTPPRLTAAEAGQIAGPTVEERLDMALDRVSASSGEA